MADETIRMLERQAAAGDRAAAARLVEERIRAGGRDPRRDPRAGDLLSVPSPTWSRAGAPAPIVRRVESTWPRLLAPSAMGRDVFPARPARPRAGDAANWGHFPEALAIGDKVLSVDVHETTFDGTALTWRVVVHLGDSGYTPMVVYNEPRTMHDDALAVEEVEWAWQDRCDAHDRRPHRCSLDAWRRWAKRATLDRVGPAPLPRCSSCGNETVEGGVKEGDILWCLACAPSPADE